jgi:hypothetical protein
VLGDGSKSSRNGFVTLGALPGISVDHIYLIFTQTAPGAVSPKFRQLVSGLNCLSKCSRELSVILARVLNRFLGGGTQIRIVIISVGMSQIAYCSGRRRETVSPDMVRLALPLSPVFYFDDYPAGCRPVDSDYLPARAVMVLVIGLADDSPAKRQRTLAVATNFITDIFMLTHNFSF